MDLATFRQHVTGTLIVSAQAPDGHPLRDTHTIAYLAAAAVAGGATAIRCGGYGGLEDIRAVAEKVNVPVIGLTKEGATGVYITPSVASARAVAHAGADVVAVDATQRPRQDGSTFAEQVAAVHEEGKLIMADIATLDEAIAEANRLPFGLGAYCFTENGRRQNQLGDEIEAGMIAINTVRLSWGDAPFGGVKESGYGSEDGPEGIANHMITKAVHIA